MEQLDYLKRLLRIAQMSAYDSDTISAYIDKEAEDGGPGSGNWGHKGRPTMVGGSAAKGAGSGGKHYRGGSSEVHYHGSRKDWVNGLTGEQNHRADQLVKKYSTPGGKNPTEEASKKIMGMLKHKMSEEESGAVSEYLQLKGEARHWDERAQQYMRENLTADEHLAMATLLGRGTEARTAPMSSREWSAFENMSIDEENYYRSLQDKAMDGPGADIPMPESLKRSMKGMGDYSHKWYGSDAQEKLDLLKSLGGEVTPEIQDDFDNRQYSQDAYEAVQAGAMKGAVDSRAAAQKMAGYVAEKMKATTYDHQLQAGEVNPYGLLTDGETDDLMDAYDNVTMQMGEDGADSSDISKVLQWAGQKADVKDLQTLVGLFNKAMGGPSCEVTGKWAKAPDVPKTAPQAKPGASKTYRKELPKGMGDFLNSRDFRKRQNGSALNDIAYMESGISQRMVDGTATLEDWSKCEDAAVRNAVTRRDASVKFTEYLKNKAKACGFKDSLDKGNADPYGLLTADESKELTDIYDELKKICSAGYSYLMETPFDCVQSLRNPKLIQDFINLTSKAMGGPTYPATGQWQKEYYDMTPDEKHEAKQKGMELRKEGKEPAMQLFPKQEKVGDAMEEAKGVNPHVSESGKKHDERYTSNCQRCVTAFLARMLGYDVQARPTYKGDTMPHGGTWKRCYVDQRSVPVISRRRDQSYNKLVQAMNKYDDGAICILRMGWTSTSGHVIIAMKQSGKVSFIDPQDPTRDTARQIRDAIPSSFELLRVDNNPFTDYVKRAVRVRGGAYDDH